MKTHNKFSAASLFVLLLILLLSACGAERPAESVSLKCRNGYEDTYYEIGFAADSVSVWYKDGMKAYVSQTILPKQIENMEKAKTEMYFADADNDGYEELFIPYRTEGENEYCFILHNNGDNTFSVVDGIFDMPNLTIGKYSIISSEKIGDFGIRRNVYSLDDGELVIENSYIEDTTAVISAVVSEYYGKSGYTVEHPFRDTPLGIRYGRIQIADFYCTAYVAYRNGEIAAAIAIGDDGKWYIDDGGISLYRELAITEGTVSLAEGDILFSSGVPYSRMTVTGFIALSETEKKDICEKMSKFITDNGEKILEEGLFDAVITAVAEADGSANLFEIVCGVCGLDDGVFLDW